MMINLKYTICFIFYKDKILLIKRKKNPMLGKWNGLGGKLEPHETPFESVIREIKEETGITLQKEVVTFSGIVTWKDSKEDKEIGMYAFLADVKEKYFDKKEINEGLLKWQKISFALDKNNTEIAHNIPYFLPEMIKKGKPKEYFCVWENDEFKKVEVLDSRLRGNDM